MGLRILKQRTKDSKARQARGGSIGTLGEKNLHSALKVWYAEPGDLAVSESQAITTFLTPTAFACMLNFDLPTAERGARNSSGTEGSRYEPKIIQKKDFAGIIEALTQSEARQIALYKGLDSFRAAIAKERSKARVGTGETLFSKQVQGEGP